MRRAAFLLTGLLLVACTAPVDTDSEAAIANSAADLERRTRINVDRAVVAIEQGESKPEPNAEN